jgi:predicted RNase H-like HicB family nuclease
MERAEAANMREVVIYRGEDGRWVVECPSLPGCVSQGKTKAEAITNIREAIDGWIETATAHGQNVPEEYSGYLHAIDVITVLQAKARSQLHRPS